jgi:hypothetical protein
MPNFSESLTKQSHAMLSLRWQVGLVRHYSWQTPLCSKKCVDRFRARREGDHNWVGWLQIAFDQLP